MSTVNSVGAVPDRRKRHDGQRVDLRLVRVGHQSGGAKEAARTSDGQARGARESIFPSGSILASERPR